MHKPYHISMTTRALSGVFSRPALDEILAANVGQDSLLNLLKSRYHFDANAFEAAFEYVREQQELVIEHLQGRHPEAARAAFGRLTHAVQDYYAHTNYVALWLEAHPEFDLAGGEPVQPLDPDVMQSERLIAARVYYPLEALTIFPGLVPKLKTMLPPDSHANMNLDSPESGPLFPFAISAAEKRTEMEYRHLASRIRTEIGENALRAFQNRNHS